MRRPRSPSLMSSTVQCMVATQLLLPICKQGPCKCKRGRTHNWRQRLFQRQDIGWARFQLKTSSEGEESRSVIVGQQGRNMFLNGNVCCSQWNKHLAAFSSRACKVKDLRGWGKTPHGSAEPKLSCRQ